LGWSGVGVVPVSRSPATPIIFRKKFWKCEKLVACDLIYGAGKNKGGNMMKNIAQNIEGQLIDDAYELEIIAHDLQLEEVPTGAIVQLGDGDYAQVWVTYSASPYSVYAEYEQVFPK